jgi:hypothetical protein
MVAGMPWGSVGRVYDNDSQHWACVGYCFGRRARAVMVTGPDRVYCFWVGAPELDTWDIAGSPELLGAQPCDQGYVAHRADAAEESPVAGAAK